jgi:Flp pilus assembly protein TadG
MLFTFFLVVLILLVGMGIDLSFAYITRARLSKAVDAACLAGIDNYWRGKDAATAIASNAFAVNYGTSGRDAVAPQVSPDFTTDGSGNTTLKVTASSQINTFFVRVLPSWKTLTVSSTAESLRAHVIMSIVLDRSGSMGDIKPGFPHNGMYYLHGAVTNFISYFDDGVDRAAQVSFSNCARIDVAIQKPFKQKIATAALALNPENWTASAPGMATGWNQVNSFTPATGEVVQKVIVFFTDGIANTFSNKFTTCGIRNVAPGPQFFNPGTVSCSSINCNNSGSTVPSVDPAYTGLANITMSNTGQMENEAEARTLVFANQARAAGTYVYCVGLSYSPGQVNSSFLARVANVDGIVSQDQPIGLSLIAPDGPQLHEAFRTIAKAILLRLTR